MASAGPLAGLMVVDFSRVLAGPFATMMMADLCARVNRGKESIALDLRDPGDRAVLDRMISRADVLVENFRPGVMDRLGLGYETLREIHPGLIYASISGFGQTGPWRLRPAYDSVVQGTSGLLSITGAPDGEPTKPGLPIGDLSAGMYAFGAICAALHGRGSGTHGSPGKPPQGARLDIAMHDSTVSLLEGAALSYLATGNAPPRIGNAHYSIAPFDTYRAKDRIFVICAANDELFALLCATIHRPELTRDARFITNRLRHDNRDELKKEMEAALAMHTAADWLEIFGTAGVPCGPVANIAEALSSEQAADRGLVIDVGGLRMPGNPMKFDGYPVTDPHPAPELDEHGPALRTEFGT